MDRMYKLIKKICFSVFLLLAFSACTDGKIESNSSSSSINSEEKAIAPLQLKEAEISLFAGESYQFQISGGRRPYSFNGVLQSLINFGNYTFTSSTDFEPGNYSVDISDTSSQTLQVKLNIKGFKEASAQISSSYPVSSAVPAVAYKAFSSSQHFAIIRYSRSFSIGSVTRTKLLSSTDSGVSFQAILESEDNTEFSDIFKTSSGKILLFLHSKDGNAKQYVSNDNATSFQNTLNIDNLKNAAVFSGSLTQKIYLAGFAKDSFGDVIIRIFSSSDDGSSWSELKEISLGQSADILSANIVNIVESSANSLVLGLNHQYYYGNSAEASSWMAFHSTNNGVSWARVEKYLYNSSYGSTLKGFHKLNSGEIVSVGIGGVTGLIGYIITRKSTDGGATWSTSNTYYNTINKSCSSVSVAQAPNGRLYVFSECKNGSNQTVAELRSSLDGSTWTLENSILSPSVAVAGSLMSMPTNTDRFIFQSYSGASLYKDQGLGQFSLLSTANVMLYSLNPISASQNANNRFQVGASVYAGQFGKNPWSILWSDDGQNWNEADQFSYPTSAAQLKHSVWLSDGSLMAVGHVNDTSFPAYWIVRRGVPSGGVYNWNTIDTFKATPTSYAVAHLIFQTSSGAVLVAGQDRSHYLLRRTTDFSNWTSVDNKPSTVNQVYPDKIFQNSANEIFIFLNEWTATGYNLFVRKSIDDGLTWQNIDLPFKGTKFKYSMTGKGDFYQTDIKLNTVTIRTSSDGCQTWNTVGTATINSIISGPMIYDNNDLYMTGSYIIGGIIYTTIRISLSDLKVTGMEKQKVQSSASMTDSIEYGVDFFSCDNNTFCVLRQEHGPRLGEKVGRIKRMIK
jgi:hypothetical protein